MKYDYMKEIKEDIKNYIEENEIEVKRNMTDEEINEIYEILWIDDSVTGNGSGSYTFNRYEAEENVSHNMDMLKEACEMFGEDPFKMLDNPEAADVTIRCYLLRNALDEVTEELTEDQAKTVIKYKKVVTYIENNKIIDEQIIEKQTFGSVKEACEYIKNTELKHYNNKKGISLYEEITATYETEDGLKRIYKNIDVNGRISSNIEGAC